MDTRLANVRTHVARAQPSFRGIVRPEVVDIVFNPFGVVGVSDSFCSDSPSCQSKVWTRGTRPDSRVLYPIPYAKPTFYSFRPFFSAFSRIFSCSPANWTVFHSISFYFILFHYSFQIHWFRPKSSMYSNVLPLGMSLVALAWTAQGHGYLATPRSRNVLAEPLGQECPHCLAAGGVEGTFYCMLNTLPRRARWRELPRTGAHWRSLEIRPVVLQSRVRIS